MWTYYETVKYVNIKDARLGILRSCLLVAIALYVGVVELWAQGGWLSSTPVVGVVRFSLQQPTVNHCDPNLPDCHNNFEPLDKLPYCQQAAGSNNSTTTTYPGTIYPCDIYEATNAQIVSEKSIAIITRASTREQKLTCQESDLLCPRTYHDTSVKPRTFYVAQSEAFTILVDHAVTASKICTTHHNNNYACSSEASKYQGRLLSKNAALCQQEHARGNAFADVRDSTTAATARAPCFITPNSTSTGQDFFSLDMLLQASNDISLDDCSGDNNSHDNNNNNTGCRTYRETGGTILLNIYWSDFGTFRGTVEPFYYYAPHVLPGLPFLQNLPFYHAYRTSRTLLKVHGFRVAILLGGDFHAFDMLAFMVTLTTALGLLAVATALVDALMLHVLPEKERYQQAKYEQEDPRQLQETSRLDGNEQQTSRPAGDMDRGDAVTANQEETLDNAIVEENDNEASLREPLL